MASLFTKFVAIFGSVRPSSWQRETAVLAATAFLVALAAILFAADGFVLYRVHFRPQTPLAPAQKGATLTERDIDEALLLLDAREKKMNAVFGEE